MILVIILGSCWQFPYCFQKVLVEFDRSIDENFGRHDFRRNQYLPQPWHRNKFASRAPLRVVCFGVAEKNEREVAWDTQRLTNWQISLNEGHETSISFMSYRGRSFLIYSDISDKMPKRLFHAHLDSGHAPRETSGGRMSRGYSSWPIRYDVTCGFGKHLA